MKTWFHSAAGIPLAVNLATKSTVAKALVSLTRQNGDSGARG